MHELPGQDNQEQAMTPPIERHEGLPLIDAAEYERLYSTDVRALGAGSATFDFQGFVKEDREGLKAGTFYRDALATNGLLKAEGHEGIHVGTDGIIDYGSSKNREMKGSQDVGEYDIYITVPGQLLKERGCVAAGDDVRSLAQYKANNPDEDQERIDELQGGQAWIVARLNLEPKEDPLARAKVKFIHTAIVRHIEEGRPLERIMGLIRSLEDELEDITEEDLAVRQLRGGV